MSVFSMGAVEGWAVTHDGETLKVFPDENQAVAWLHKRHSYSVDHAVTYEGYDVVFVKDGRVEYSYRQEGSRRKAGHGGLAGLSPAQKEELVEALYDALSERATAFLADQAKNGGILTREQAALIMDVFADGWLVDIGDPSEKAAKALVKHFDQVLRKFGGQKA